MMIFAHSSLTSTRACEVLSDSTKTYCNRCSSGRCTLVVWRCLLISATTHHAHNFAFFMHMPAFFMPDLFAPRPPSCLLCAALYHVTDGILTAAG